MNILTILVLILIICALAAALIMYYGLAWVEHHYINIQSSPQETWNSNWEVITDDFGTVKSFVYSGNLISLRLVWSWSKMKWLYKFFYKPYFAAYDPYL